MMTKNLLVFLLAAPLLSFSGVSTLFLWRPVAAFSTRPSRLGGRASLLDARRPVPDRWPLFAVEQKHNKKTSPTSSSSSSSQHTTPSSQKNPTHHRRRRAFPKRAVQVYVDYAGRLWNETNPDARRRMASSKAEAALRQVQQIFRYSPDEKIVGTATDDDEDETDVVVSMVDQRARQQLLGACDEILASMDHANTTSTALSAATSSALATTTDASPSTPNQPAKKKKNRRSILFGATMGAIVACWVFSGNYIFTGLFTLMTILGQLEYYRMIMNTGVYPARRISVVGACTMFLTALFFPNYHQICLPLFGLWTMVWFLTMRRKPATIPEIATTFTGMFYLGYVPSFWVRIRLFGGAMEPTRLAPLVAPLLAFVQRKAHANLPTWIPQAVHLPITPGAIFIFWTWLSLAFSDVGAYFVGKFHGRTKLGAIFPTAGATSPKKTVEGVVGGCAVSAVLSVLGAWVQKWPLWPLTGAIHGVMLGLLGLLGDLTASMLKRDAGLKDFGDLLPEHGGVMDRVDSFIWSAPYSWLVCTTIIPALRQWAV